MRFRLAIFCLMTFTCSAYAQSGVSSQRDMYGNLVRQSGPYSTRGINQGPINNGAIRNAPSQSSTTHSGIARQQGR
jgi:hypothetical protein